MRRLLAWANNLYFNSPELLFACSPISALSARTDLLEEVEYLCAGGEAGRQGDSLLCAGGMEEVGNRAPENLKMAGNWPKVAAMRGLQNYQKAIYL